MNKRIKELHNQACRLDMEHYPNAIPDGERIQQKFVELIIKECAKSLWTEECHTSDLALEEFERNSAKIKEHFGVEE